MSGPNHDAVGVAVLGLGFMGRTHIGAYRAANAAGHENELVAVCDSDRDRRRGLPGGAGNFEKGEKLDLMFDPTTVLAYADPAELFADSGVQLVSICTHTDSHVDLAIQALEAGKHVLVEKPVALHSADVERLADAAEASSTLCMPAHCMRFWPAWRWLRDVVAVGRLLRQCRAHRRSAGRPAHPRRRLHPLVLRPAERRDQRRQREPPDHALPL